MRTLPSIACLSLLTLLAACGESSSGYYNANGDYIYNSTNGSAPFEHDVTLRDHMRNENRAKSTDATYAKRGYYDYDGTYSTTYNDGLTIPKNMFPARGLCRVWFTDRAAQYQPKVESCTNIKQRVPVGAYVIYGG